MASLALLVEDAPEYVAVGRRILADEGYEVLVTGDGTAALDVARRHHPELILLDVGLPGLDGFDTCRHLRTFTDAYVVMLTARGDEIDRVLGLSAGADDYVVKPFSARELGLRIRAMRRRPRQPVRVGHRSFGELELDLAAREAVVAGRPAALTRIEFDLLATLAGRPRCTLTRGQLRDAVWGQEWFGDDHVIDVHLGNLRRKLRGQGRTAGSDRHIVTVRGVGYRFDP
ncbi:response regulator transcription factor [Nakamurella sp.]|uniref:response regulator transcription factor n=1 Tax=Nakamurella sp. TaxID=1869182 RepID=UPI003B3AD82D